MVPCQSEGSRMGLTASPLPTTRFRYQDNAQLIADACAAGDPDATYTVEPSGEMFVITIRDAADGYMLGTL